VRLPWRSIDDDGETRGRLLGRLLGVHELQGVGMAIALWRAAVEFSRDGDFAGEVPSPEFIAAACSWPTEDAKRLVAALQQVGLIATHPALRVRGLDRYRRTWEKNQNFHRNSAKSRPRVPSTGAKPAKDGAKDEDEDEDEVTTLPAPTQIWPQPPKPKRQPKPSAAQEFFGWLTATRSSKTQLSDSSPSPRAINGIFGKALTEVGRHQLEQRYLAYLNDPDWGTKTPPWPWEGFVKRWRWLQPAAAQRNQPLEHLG
jgi:hypothetical protein